MVDIDPIKNVLQNPHISDNILSKTEESQNLQFVDFGFTCVIGQPVPDSNFLLFLKFSIGNYYYTPGLDTLPQANIQSFQHNYSSFPTTANSSIADSLVFNDSHHEKSCKCNSAWVNPDMCKINDTDSYSGSHYLRHRYLHVTC